VYGQFEVVLLASDQEPDAYDNKNRRPNANTGKIEQGVGDFWQFAKAVAGRPKNPNRYPS